MIASASGRSAEPMLVEALVPELAVEALDVRVLDRLPGLDKMQMHPLLMSPLVHHETRELRPVIQDYLRRQSPREREVIEHPHNSVGADRWRHLDVRDIPA